MTFISFKLLKELSPFSSEMINVTIYGLICVRDDYPLLVFFSIRSEGVLPCTTVHQKSYEFITMVRRGTKNEATR